MEIASILSVVFAVTLLIVGLFRIKKATPYRGGQAQNMKEEFEVYGLPHWLLPIVGVLKVGLAIALVISLWMPILLKPVALGIAALMLAAVLMHLKVSDG
ncbi:MAG: DoxX family protein, partial [Verrucomicrobiota bacterium]|nr:DoxX family protein [Verrucomicrobiota bacterium]